jgi:peptidoglycan hydrolase-like protein with peptidoglycan-binding domain
MIATSPPNAPERSFMSRSIWAAVGAGVFVLTLGLLAALAASPSVRVQSATSHAKPSYPVPIIHHIAVVHTPALAHPEQHATKRPRRAARPAVTQRRLVVLAAGSGYQQVAGSGLVRTLQRRLAGLGFAPGPIDGRYGPRTTLAVERFQSARRLTVDGVMGARSFAALDATPRSGLAAGTGSQQPSRQVRVLQRRLLRLGFRPGPIDGRYGPRTTLAVERFQSARRLTVKGVVDASTLRALRSGKRPARTARPTNHPISQPPPAAPEGRSTSVRPADRQPGLPVTLVLLGLAALGLCTILLSYGRTRARARRQPAHGEQTKALAPELVSVGDTDGANGEDRR